MLCNRCGIVLEVGTGLVTQMRRSGNLTGLVSASICQHWVGSKAERYKGARVDAGRVAQRIGPQGNARSKLQYSYRWLNTKRLEAAGPLQCISWSSLCDLDDAG